MTPDEKQNLDRALLRYLDPNHTSSGLSAEALAHGVLRYGLRPSVEDVTARMDYLTDHGLTKPVAKTIGRAVRHWQITDAGREWLDENCIH